MYSLGTLRNLLELQFYFSFRCSNPFCFFLLFTQLLTKLGSIPKCTLTARSRLFRVCHRGYSVMQNAFGSVEALQSGNSIVADIDSGFLQKMLVTPMSRPAILLGRLFMQAPKPRSGGNARSNSNMSMRRWSTLALVQVADVIFAAVTSSILELIADEIP